MERWRARLLRDLVEHVRKIDIAIIGGLALVLTLPGFQFPYLFDDFEFLERVINFQPDVLLPDPRQLFYRPISREAFFRLIQLFGRDGAFLGHLLNALAIATAAAILYNFSSRLLGRRAGLVTGTVFAAFGPNAVLVAWVSGSQDALAIVFLALALFLEVKGRHFPAVAVAGLALLSKETAAAVIPAIALAPRLLGIRDDGTRRRMADYAILLVLWAAVHPGIHLLLRGGFRGDEAAYIGIDNPSRWSSLWKSLVTLLNVPFNPAETRWWRPLGPIVAPALALGVYAGWRISRVPPGFGSAGLRIASRVAVLGLLLALPPLLLTSLIVKHWAPYYVCIPAIGVAVAAGAGASRLPSRTLPLLLALFVAAGLWARTVRIEPGLPSERTLTPAAGALRVIERQVRALVPTVQPGTQFLVFIMAQGSSSVHLHFYHFQVLRSWFQDQTVTADRPELRVGGSRPEVLLWVSSDFAVYRVDPETLLPRSAAGKAPYDEYQKVMRAYARGLATSGDLGRALEILLGMPEPNAFTRDLDLRIAAALLLANNRRQEAELLLRDVSPLSIQESIDFLAGLLSAPARSTTNDGPWFEACGLSPGDAGIVRTVMEQLNSVKNPAAERMALRLLALQPGDRRAIEILSDVRRYPNEFAITPRGR